MKARALRVPETLQTSAMDCGPAALRSLLVGIGLRVGYERLREACRTGADGTSIDAIEDFCLSLGLEAHQEMASPLDAPEALRRLAPAIVVVKGPGGAPHFVVVWRVLFGFVEIMDPARGRYWTTEASLRRALHVHAQPFDDAAFAAWFPGTAWADTSRERARMLGAETEPRPDAGLEAFGAIDAAARAMVRIAQAARLRRRGLWSRAVQLAEASRSGSVALPAELASVERRGEQTLLRGAVFLVIRAGEATSADAGEAQRSALARVAGDEGPSLATLLVAQLGGQAARFGALVTILVLLVAGFAMVEMLLLRAALGGSSVLALAGQRAAGVVAYGVLVLGLLAAETALGASVARLGRTLELRLRLALLGKMPRLPAHYFATRPLSDVTHRSLGLFEAKPLPGTLATLVKLAVDVIVTAIAMCAIHPAGAPWTIAGLAFALAAPAFSVRVRRDAEVRTQAHASELGQLHLDVLRGLAPLASHGGRFAIEAKLGGALAAWRAASSAALRLLVATEVVVATGVLACVLGVLLSYVKAHEAPSGLVLLAFWSLRLPAQARGLAAAASRLPRALASLSRVVEPLTTRETPEDEDPGDERTLVLDRRRGIALRLRHVSVRLGAEQVLHDLSLDVPSGERIAVVGSSGAGKSTLVGVLLGLVQRTSGTASADGFPLEEYDLGRLRRETIWVDPAVQLWNRPFLENLRFGNPDGARHPMEPVLDLLGLDEVVARAPRGLATELGESGARVSGGEGQRVRVGRGLLRRGARLVLLDEAFRGLDREKRRELSRAVRERCKGATVLEVTHDVSDTLDFDRVLVIENGRLVEDGAPAKLLVRAGSRYGDLVARDRAALRSVWDDPRWRRVRVGGGRVEVSEPIEEHVHG